ncbi:MAG: aconitase X catalytic domain-containing protein [Desulfurococcales archaeon]|nr:aconitase X catalytic domain-containing protein [Desulfurococcales archaeon]
MVLLTREEEEILEGKMGEAKARALEAIVKVAESLGAERLIRIEHAHISGVSYGTIGEPGRRFIEDLYLSGARVSVPTTVNPIGFDDADPANTGGILKVDKDFLEGQQAIIRALTGMGANPVLTCTPYKTRSFASLNLKPGSHVAWGESSAVAYANTVLGIWTNREGGPLALLASIAGRTYYYGVHIPENRIPSETYRVEIAPVDEVDAGVVAEILAETHDNDRPPLVEMGLPPEPYRDIVLREFSAALGAAGNISMAVIPGITPVETRGMRPGPAIEIEARLIISRRKDLAPGNPVDFIFLGCPHLAADDLKILDHYLNGKARIPIIATLSRDAYERAGDHIRRLQAKGVRFIRSTCLIVGQLKSRDYSIATNSYKAYFYLRRKVSSVGLLSLPALARLAVNP